MNFDEALKRYVGTDPREINEPQKATKKVDHRKRLQHSDHNKTKPEKT
jgi:hypothetical protein